MIAKHEHDVPFIIPPEPRLLLQPIKTLSLIQDGVKEDGPFMSLREWARIRCGGCG